MTYPSWLETIFLTIAIIGALAGVFSLLALLAEWVVRGED